MKTKVLGSEAACGTSTTNGSSFGSSTAVRLHNSGAAARLVSVETSANVLIGTSLPLGTVILPKGSSSILIVGLYLPAPQALSSSTNVGAPR